MLKVVLSPATNSARRSIVRSTARATLAACAALVCLTSLGTAQDPGIITQLFAFPCPPQQSSFCSQGYAPNVLLEASDGNFYGAAQLTTIGSSNSQGGNAVQNHAQRSVHVAIYFSPKHQRELRERQSARDRPGGGQ